jgi:hypothetical protein
MNTTQTPPLAVRSQPNPSARTLPALPSLTRAILADWDNPAISELELAERHGLTLEALYHHSQTPAFRAALGFRRRLRDERRESYLQHAQDHAAEVLATLSKRPPDSIAAAKEIRLALKELIRLRSLGAAKPAPTSSPDAATSPAPGVAGEVAERSEGGGGRPAAHTPDQAVPQSGGMGAAAPTPQTLTGSPLQGDEEQNAPHSADEQAARSEERPRPNPHKPKSPRGYKCRPKPKSR